MIQYNPKSWFSLIFDIYSRYVLRTLFPMMLFGGLFTALFCFIVIDVFELHYKGNVAFHSILGMILGLFLVLRTNTAYDRWWEGRKLWGQLVNDCRHLSIKLNSLLPKEAIADREFFRRMLPNITFAMKEQLRDSKMVGEMDLSNLEERELIVNSIHRPNMVTNILFERVHKLRKEGRLTNEDVIVLDQELKGFTNIIGACERIKNTPIPYSYRTVPVIMLAFYFLMSVELIAEEIEDPFGKDLNDLPLDELCVKIKKNILENIRV
jgi:putative membrane protein